MADQYERQLRKLETRVMRLEGVEALIQAVYIPGRRGGDVALSINQGHPNGSMDQAKMVEFVSMIVDNLVIYRTKLQLGEAS